MTYKVQIDDLVRDATPEEITKIEAGHSDAEGRKAQDEAKATAKASALAKLAALGLTADEIAAL